MKMKKKIFIISILFLMFFGTCCYAHSGKTDSNGGHYNHYTGEYHYHHGYSEHKHINGLCPYECEIEDIIPSKCQHCKASINPDNGFYCFECGYNTLEEYDVLLLSTADGPADKTRSEYYKEVESLEEKLEEKDAIIEQKDAEIKNFQNAIFNNTNESSSQRPDNENSYYYTVCLLVASIIGVIIAYYQGIKKRRKQMNIENLYNIVDKENIKIYDYYIVNSYGAFINLENINAIAMNYKEIPDSLKEKETLAEELGHYYMDATYSISCTDTVLISKQEYRAKKWSYNVLIPFENLRRAILNRI